MSRLAAYGIGLCTVAATASPALDPRQQDSYPLSTYPMFSRARDNPTLYFAEGLDAEGRSVRLVSALIASQEVMQTAATVRRAIQAGPGATEALCSEIARRLAQSADHRHVLHVRLLSARFDPIVYFTKGRIPEALVEHGRCPVAGSR
jgi:alkylhydroperoxidase/carboxymuconolactone decarboxylase family protein YurZ